LTAATKQMPLKKAFAGYRPCLWKNEQMLYDRVLAVVILA